MVEIALQSFDQNKLEQLLRLTPVAFVREENQGKFLRKHYLFPKESAPFLIKCHADHFNSSPVPSSWKCSLTAYPAPIGDEIAITTKNFGIAPQKFYSFERVYGQTADGYHRQLFRYIFDCSKETCKVTFAVKEATP